MDPRDFIDEMFARDAAIATQARACFDFFEFHTGLGRWSGVPVDQARVVALHVLVVTAQDTREEGARDLHRVLRDVAAYNLATARQPWREDLLLDVSRWRPPHDPPGHDHLCLLFADEPAQPFLVRTDADIEVHRMPTAALIDRLADDDHPSLSQLLIRQGTARVPDLIDGLVRACGAQDAHLQEGIEAALLAIAEVPQHRRTIRDLVLDAPDVVFRKLGLLLTRPVGESDIVTG